MIVIVPTLEDPSSSCRSGRRSGSRCCRAACQSSISSPRGLVLGQLDRECACQQIFVSRLPSSAGATRKGTYIVVDHYSPPIRSPTSPASPKLPGPLQPDMQDTTARSPSSSAQSVFNTNALLTILPSSKSAAGPADVESAANGGKVFDCRTKVP